MFGIIGDGYEGKKSPHSKMESFQGITLSRTIFLVYFGLLDRQYLDLFLKVTDMAMVLVKQNFDIRKELYFSYTHLVCRAALPGNLLF